MAPRAGLNLTRLLYLCCQVDAYREAGKLEAAARLEDQLHLIHGRFQVRNSATTLASSAVEVFAGYRLHAPLGAAGLKMYLTVSHSPDARH